MPSAFDPDAIWVSGSAVRKVAGDPGATTPIRDTTTGLGRIPIELDHGGFVTDPTTTNEATTSTALANIWAALGSAATEDVGTAIGNVVQLVDVGGSAALPAVDGSQLTGIDAGSGDMLVATYDPAAVSEQLLGLTAAQTTTNKRLGAGSSFDILDAVAQEITHDVAGALDLSGVTRSYVRVDVQAAITGLTMPTAVPAASRFRGISVDLVQDATGGHAISGLTPLAGGTVAPAVDTAANAVTSFGLQVYGTGSYEVVGDPDLSGTYATAAQGTLADSALQPAAIGDSVQGYHVNLAALAGLSGVADRLAYFTGVGAMALATLTSFGRSLVAAADAAAARAVLSAQEASTALTEWAGKARPTGDAVGTTDQQTVTSKQQPLADDEETAAFTFGLDHARQRMVRFNAATGADATIPPNSSVAFPVGTVIQLVQWDAGQATLAAGAGVTLNKPASRTLASREQYSVIGAWKQATDVWVAFGDLADA